jgi:phage tail-like protein
MAELRSYVAGNFFFQMDGVKCGFIKSMDGGAITAEVINEPSGPSYFVKKHIGTPKYEDFTMQIGFSMSKAVYDWIAASWQMNYQRKNGAVIACDYKLDAKSQREFFNALITETGIPACDGASKEPAYLTLKYAPEYTRYTKASGKASGEFGKNEQKLFLPQNFRLTIDGLDCTKVAKVDAFTVKQTAVTDDIGDSRDYLKEPGKLEFPNLKITMSEVAAQTWYDWHEDFVIKGNNDEGREKNGVLEFLSPNRQDVIFTVKFFNLGIFKISTDKSEANADAIKRVSGELYCERMEVQTGKPVIA